MCIKYENQLAKHTSGRTSTASRRISGEWVCAQVWAISGESRKICVRIYLNIILSTCVRINICGATYGRECVCVCVLVSNNV